MMKKDIIIILFLVIFIVNTGGVLAQQSFYGTRTGSATFVDYQRYYSSDDGTGTSRLRQYWPIFSEIDPESCVGRQDLLIQVAPFGCQPSVVRSDLLAEQNVPVFCQLDAIRLNPLIDIKQIRNIRFVGNYPKEVVGAGFHPARAALRTRNDLLGSPLINNIGYVVVVLRRNPVEKELPNFVNLTLRARVEYYASNVLGIGRTQFILKPVSDNEWKVERNKNSFYQGRYSVRLEEADAERAVVSLYHGDRRVSNIIARKGKPSDDLYLPGAYCQVGLKVHYDGFKAAENTARIQVGDDVFEVYEGSRFLNDRCSVREINVKGEEAGSVEFTCGSNKFSLSIAPKSFKKEDEVYLYDSTAPAEDRILYDEGKWIIIKVNEVSETVDGKTIKRTVSYDLQKVSGDGKKENIPVANVSSVSGEKLSESVYNATIEKYFKDTINTYKQLADDYPLEKDGGDAKLAGLQTFGEQGLERAIGLAEYLNKRKTAVELINLYTQIYPESGNSSFYLNRLNREYRFDLENSQTTVEADNNIESVRLLEIKQPTKKSKATLSYGGERFELELNGNTSLADRNFTLERVEENSAVVRVDCGNERKSPTLRINQEEKDICGSALKLVDTDVENYAIIRIEPVARGPLIETNVTVGVGIEKRAIKLTPDKTKERIENLNKTIEKWDKISNSMGNVVKGMKAACFATAGVLTVKNFVTGLSGEALARQRVMRGPNGWTEFCQKAVNNGEYDRSMGRCLNENAGNISTDVNLMKQKIEANNQDIKTIEGSSGITKSGGLFEEYVDGEKAKDEFIENHFGSYTNEPVSLSGNVETNVGSLVAEVNGKRYLTYDEATQLKLNLDVANDPGASSVLRESAKKNVERVSQVIYDRKQFNQLRGNLPISVYRDEDQFEGKWSGFSVADWKKSENGGLSLHGNIGVSDNAPAEVVGYKKELYLFVFDDNQLQGDLRQASKVYKVKRTGANALVTEGEDIPEIRDKFGAFKKADRKSCINKFRNPEVKYYETEPYKGLPALVPFDLNEGWYVGTQQTIPAFGGIKAFQSSGRPTSFWICNVGADGEADFFVTGFDDDDCQRFNIDTGQALNKFACLGEDETRRLVNRAISALNEAARKRQAGKAQGYNIEIEGQTMKVGAPAVDIPGTQCQDFMSPEDCKLLFNVCDPVICPNSRCDFGGTYHVADVIQSGIVGSVLLCLPNYKENILVPVCLSGIKAGIDGYLSILKSHRQCLQENLETGRHVGICDQITSVYMCEFFWRQAAPVANILLPKAIEYLYTGGGVPRGGGEYLTVQSAWDNAQQSVNYFTQSYAVNSFEAFNLRSVDEAGTTFCRAFVSAKAPSSFESLIEPDSPPQFHAWFSSIPFSDVTVPATSQYKVFYHIFAGNDRGVYYSVYLKDPIETSFFQTSAIAPVENGFVARGEFRTNTRDFTAPSGYQQLCVRINDKEECGFKEVSSSFAVNYVRDKFVGDEINRREIKTENECIAGRTNPSALLNPNIQEAAQEAIDPAVYNRGVVRICATRNPGESTDPTRFVEVGYCDNERVKCWLDSQSVDRAISVQNIGQRQDTLAKINETFYENIAKSKDGFLYGEEAGNKINEINVLPTIKQGEEISRLNEIDNLLEQVIINSQKAKLLFLKAQVYEAVTRTLFGKEQPPKVDAEAVPQPGQVAGEKETTEPEQTEPIIQPEPESEATSSLTLTLSQNYVRTSTIKNYFLANGKRTEPEMYLDGRNVMLTREFLGSDFLYPNKRIGSVSEQNVVVLLDSAKSDISDYFVSLNGARIDGAKIIESGTKTGFGDVKEAEKEDDRIEQKVSGLALYASEEFYANGERTDYISVNDDFIVSVAHTCNNAFVWISGDNIKFPLNRTLEENSKVITGFGRLAEGDYRVTAQCYDVGKGELFGNYFYYNFKVVK